MKINNKRCSRIKKETEFRSWESKYKSKKNGVLSSYKGMSSVCNPCKTIQKTKDMRKYRSKNPNYFNELRNKNKSKWKSNELLQSARRRAMSKSLDFDLDKEWVEMNMSRKCALSNIPFSSFKGEATIYSPSIDRINPNLGYTKSNCRMVLWGLNAFKGISGDADMLHIIRQVYKHTVE